MSKLYHVKEIFTTLQGEGYHTGRRAVFCRFKFCNLWTGVESDRANAACPFCDTDFISDGDHAGRYHAAHVAQRCADVWGADHRDSRFAVLTGGEPLLQVDDLLVEALHRFGFMVQVETNGTRPAPAGIDWITVSPKAGQPLVQKMGDELKIVHPQEGLDPAEFVGLDFAHRFLQPKAEEGAAGIANIQSTVAYCLADPRWRLGIQVHKVVGLP